MRKEILLFSVLYLSISFLAMPSVYAQQFPCDGSFYFVSTNTVVGSQFYKITIDTATHSFNYEEIPLDNPDGRHITCLGYNITDQFIYGLDFDTYELLRLKSDGSITNLGVPTNLDTTFEYYAGGMTPDGRRLMIIARNPTTGLDERVYLIQVNDGPAYYAGYFSIVSDAPVAIVDIAVDPILGTTYGFDLNNKQVMVTDPTGLTSTGHRSFATVGQGFGALFFGQQGQLYGLGSASGSGEQSTFYRIDKFEGEVVELDRAAGGRDTDGCACPYQFDFTKTIRPKETVNCNEVTIEYNIFNRAGIGYASRNIVDQLPDYFNILEIEMDNAILAIFNSGVGSNLLDISRKDLVLGENRITVTAEVRNAPAGTYESQAIVEPFPAGLNFNLFSDDPNTLQISDPTSLEIIDVESINLLDFAVPSCNLDTMYLTLPLQGEYLWSNGSTESQFAATSNGTYAVIVTNDCYVYEGEAFIKLATEALFVDAGEDINTELGTSIALDFQTNANSIQRISWEVVSGDSILNCINCAQPNFIATQDFEVLLTITDERGCEVSDLLNIAVADVKNIYFPNVFSPNSDGVNDVFFIQGPVGEVVSFQVYDRWSNQVFLAKEALLNEPSSGWDGTIRGEKAHQGLYLWSAIIQFPDGKSVSYAGEILLVQ